MKSKLLVSILTLVFSAQTFGASLAARDTRLTLSTLNLKWYGIGGFMWNTPEQEYRQENLKQFIDEVLPDSEVIVFTEVVDTEAAKQLVRDRMDCVTYEGAWSRHQHIVTCYDKNRFRAETYDGDYVIQEADLGSGGLRPATQTKICYKNSRCILQVIGVHLAAGNKTEKRTQQVEFINAELAKQQDPLPTVVTGDFNSYIKEQTKGSEDDIEIFERTLSKNAQNFNSVTKHIKTYNSGERGRAYDHIVVSSDIKVHWTRGYEACEKSPDLRKQFIPYQSYRRYYTDHCPVTASLEFN